jgi:hypothetical protein
MAFGDGLWGLKTRGIAAASGLYRFIGFMGVWNNPGFTAREYPWA